MARPILYIVHVKNQNPDLYLAHIDGHRAWINKHADASFVLCGPFEDRAAGGMIIAQSESREALDRILAEEKRCQLDRLYQRITDDLDALVREVGLKIAA